MDEGLEAKIGAILSDPQQMEKISNLAMQLMGSGSAESGNNLGEKQEEQVSSAMGREADTGLGAMLSGLMRDGGKQSKSETLLMAMRPYLRPGRQEKLEKALRISRALRLAGTVMQGFGGGGFGL